MKKEVTKLRRAVCTKFRARTVSTSVKGGFWVQNQFAPATFVIMLKIIASEKLRIMANQK